MRSVDSPISMPARCQSDCSTDCVIILRPGGVIISMKASQRHDGRVHLASRPLRPQLEACTGVPSERGRARGSSFATQPLQTPPHQPLGPRPPCRLSSIHPPPPRLSHDPPDDGHGHARTRIPAATASLPPFVHDPIHRHARFPFLRPPFTPSLSHRSHSRQRSAPAGPHFHALTISDTITSVLTV